MSQWTRARWWSFGIHTAFVSIPFLASSASALLFWRSLFGSWWLAAPMVAVVDILALAGLVLYIVHIPSPFVPLRHILPFVSVVPLGIEVYMLLAHNGRLTAVIVTVIVIALMVAVAWQCFRTIERLFVPPVEAAREKAREQLTALTVELAQLTEKNAVVSDFFLAWRGQTVTATITDASVPLSENESKTARVKALAAENGVSESTAWRKIKAGEWRVTE